MTWKQGYKGLRQGSKYTNNTNNTLHLAQKSMNITSLGRLDPKGMVAVVVLLVLPWVILSL